MCRYIFIVVAEYFSPPTFLPYWRDFHLDGQIGIFLNWPIYKEDAVIAGAKVICSRYVYLAPSVPCYDGLVPFGTTDILLSLLDATKKYYVVLQMVRNFNGHELIEPNLDEVSSTLCTG